MDNYFTPVKATILTRKYSVADMCGKACAMCVQDNVCVCVCVCVCVSLFNKLMKLQIMIIHHCEILTALI